MRELIIILLAIITLAVVTVHNTHRKVELIEQRDIALSTVEELQLIVAGLTKGNAIVTAELVTSLNAHRDTKDNHAWEITQHKLTKKEWQRDKTHLSMCVATLKAVVR